jgi:hypothetical protein
MAAEAKIPYATGNDPATVEANRKYQEAQRLLSESLDSRKNRFFDPVWLAAAQGFGAPTQTGGFGESLGNAMKAVGSAQEQELKGDQEIAQRRVALAGQGVEMAKLQSNDLATRRIIENLKGPQQPAQPPQQPPQPTGALPTPAAPINGPAAPPVAGPLSAPAAPPVPAPPVAPPMPAPVMQQPPAAPPAPAAAPAPQGPLTQPAAPPSNFNLRGVPFQEPNPLAYPTLQEFLEMQQGKGRPLADLMLEYQTKIAPNETLKLDSGVLNRRTGVLNTAVSAKNIDTPIFGPGYEGKTFNIPESDAIMLRQYQREQNWPAYSALADNVTGKTSNFGPDGKPTQIKPVNERELEKERAKAISEADTAEEVESRKNFAQRGKNANDTLATANTIRRFTENPNFSKMTGILSNDKVSSGIATLIRDGIGSRGFSIGVPAIEEVMRNANLSKEEQAQYRVFLMQTAQMQLDAEKSMKGSTTERERLLLGNSKISPQDTAEAVRMKADLLTAKAQFDKRAYRAFKASKMTADEFLESPEYEKMHVKLIEDLADLSTGLTKLSSSPARSAKGGKGGKDLEDAKRRLEEKTR